MSLARRTDSARLALAHGQPLQPVVEGHDGDTELAEICSAWRSSRRASPHSKRGALFGMVPIEPDESLRETLSALRRSLRLSFKALAQWQLGLMPDGRLAVVDPREVPTRCAISRRILPRRVYRAVSPVEPLPAEEANRLLNRMLPNVDWDSFPWDEIEREREQEQQRQSRSQMLLGVSVQSEADVHTQG